MKTPQEAFAFEIDVDSLHVDFRRQVQRGLAAALAAKRKECADKIEELKEERKKLRAERKKLKAAIRKLLKDPDGCSLCAFGVTRNAAKGHQPDCPFENAKALI